VKDIEGWSIRGASTFIGECGGYTMIGGYGNFGAGAAMSRTFGHLPPHNQIRIKFQFWKIDSWDNEMFYCSVDGQKLEVFQGQYNAGVQLCGENSDWKEEVIDFELIVDHTADSLTIGFTSSLD